MIARININKQPDEPLRFLIGYPGQSFLSTGMWFLDQDGALVHVPPEEPIDE